MTHTQRIAAGVNGARVLAAAAMVSIATPAWAGMWVGEPGDTWDMDIAWFPAYQPGTSPTASSTEDFYIMLGDVTVNTDTSPYVANWRDLLVNAGGNTTWWPPYDGTTLTVTPTGKLSVGRTLAVGMGATLNINGGEVDSNGAAFGDGRRGAHNFGPAIVNMTAGTFTPSSTSLGANGGYAVGTMSGGTWTTEPFGSMSVGSSTLYAEVAGNVSTFTQTGGTMIQPRGIAIGVGHEGVYNLSGSGTLNITDGSSVGKGLRVGVATQGAFNMTGGTASIRRAQIGPTALSSGSGSADGVGVMTISGGTVTGGIFQVGGSDNLGSGTLRIVGHDATIDLEVGAGAPGALYSYANGTLNFQIGAEGVSSIAANSSSPGGRTVLNLSGTLDLDLLDGFVPAAGETFTLVTTNVTSPFYLKDETHHHNDPAYLAGYGIITEAGTYTAWQSSFELTNTGLSLAAADQATWAFDVVALDGNAGYALTATYLIPEPASLALLGLGGVLMLARRRQT